MNTKSTTQQYTIGIGVKKTNMLRTKESSLERRYANDTPHAYCFECKEA